MFWGIEYPGKRWDEMLAAPHPAAVSDIQFNHPVLTSHFAICIPVAIPNKNTNSANHISTNINSPLVWHLVCEREGLDD